MTESDDTSMHEGPDTTHTTDPAAGVRGGDAAERMDGGNENVGRGADGDTAAREALRVDLGERSGEAGQESGDAGLDGDAGRPEL